MAPVPEEAASIDQKSETGRTAFTSSSSISNSISGICTTVIIMFTSGHRCFTKAGQKMGKIGRLRLRKKKMRNPEK